jgi:hypothetical protein
LAGETVYVSGLPPFDLDTREDRREGLIRKLNVILIHTFISSKQASSLPWFAA